MKAIDKHLMFKDAIGNPTLHCDDSNSSLLSIQFEGLGIPAFVVDRNGVVCAWTRKLQAFPLKQGSRFDDLIHSQDVASWNATLQECLYSDKTVKCTVRILDGVFDWTEFCLQLSTVTGTEMNSVEGVVCCVLSEHGAKPSPDESQYSTRSRDSQLYTQILNSLQKPLVVLDSTGSILLWNQDMELVSGCPLQGALGKLLVRDFTEQRQHDTVQDALNRVMTGESIQNFQLTLQVAQGETVCLELSLSPLSMTSDRVGVLIVVQDRINTRAEDCSQIMDTADIMIFGVDPNGIVDLWNIKMEGTTGFSRADAFNHLLVQSFVAESHKQVVQSCQWNALHQGRGTPNVELEIVTRNGDTRCLLASISARRNAQNSIIGTICFAHDVTESSKHNRTIASMASELRLLIDSANAPIFGIDCSGLINEWNDKTAEITGFSKEEAFGCSLVETFIVPCMRESVQDVLNNALKGRGTSNYQLEFRTKSNHVRYLLVNATTRRDSENNVVGVVGVAQDVTESVQRDRAVVGMALELRQLIETANAPIFGIDVDGNVNEWNMCIQTITGYSKEETFGEPLVGRFIAPKMKSRVQGILEAALRGNETSNYEIEMISKSGEPRFMVVNATTRRDPECNVVGVVGVAQDVTEDRKHAAELRKMQYLQAAQDAKVETERNMTAYFAHELRNPLGAIDSALRAMPDNLPPEAMDLVWGMQSCSSFMSSIMNNLLDVRKMEEGKMTLTVQPISLRALVISVHQMLFPSVKPGVSFDTVCLTNGHDWVLGDEHRIQQVLTNVVTNAIKYTVYGSITLKIYWDDGDVIFECIDTGPGIPPSEQERLFERFVQRGGAPGTGLGLAIAKHLTDLMGGNICFESDPSVRAGTTCIVKLPLKPCDSPDAPVEILNSRHLIEEPIRILIIDDVKLNRTMLKRRLQKGVAPNCVIEEASTGEEALEICAREKFDVMIVDQFMEEAGGVMVGTDVVYAMRRMRINAIIIGCSGNDLDDEFAEAGADWVWKKPMPSNEDIIDDLRTALALRNENLF